MISRALHVTAGRVTLILPVCALSLLILPDLSRQSQALLKLACANRLKWRLPKLILPFLLLMVGQAFCQMMFISRVRFAEAGCLLSCLRINAKERRGLKPLLTHGNLALAKLFLFRRRMGMGYLIFLMLCWLSAASLGLKRPCLVRMSLLTKKKFTLKSLKVKSLMSG